MIRVVLPTHLRNLANINGEVTLEVTAPVTQQRVLDELEAKYPMLKGTIRDRTTLRRRAFIRFFADGEDLSHEAPGTELPSEVTSGREPLVVVGAMAGG